MQVLTSEFTKETRGFNDTHDITDRVAEAVREAAKLAVATFAAWS